MNKYCTFNSIWLDDPQYFWLARDDTNKHQAHCVLCRKSFTLGKMGYYAVKTHMKGIKHQELVKSKGKSQHIGSLLKNSQSQITKSTVDDVLPGSSVQATLDSSVTKNDVLDSEIIWCLQTITSHNSYKSNENISAIFQRIFHDSSIAKNFTCGEKKTAYVTVFGIAPFLKQSLVENINEQDNFVLLFDESLNNTLQMKQLDIHVRYWQADAVKSVYFTSVFMGHATSEDIMTSISSAIFPLNLSKIIQISMDGPNVNLKFLKMFQDQFFKDFQKKTLNVGTCALHTVHNSFQSGLAATEWELDSFLLCLYSLFKDSPARREDFCDLNGFCDFPKKFVQHRWLENIEVMERALYLLPYLQTYLDAVNKKKVPAPSSKSYVTVANHMKDTLLSVKLHISISIAKVLHPFLVRYQNEKPILFFMTEDLKRILLSILQRFIKPDILKNISTPLRLVDFEFENARNHVDFSKVDIGFIAEKELKSLLAAKKISDSDVFNIRMGAKKFFVNITRKIVEKSPISLSLVRSLDCFNPHTMTSSKDNCIKKCKFVLTTLVAANQVSENDCDKIILEYRMFLDSVVPKYFSEFKEFDFNSRLDQFFVLYMNNNEYPNLWKVVKMLLILSHGQASVERGFSVNKQIEVENMLAETYAAQRLVCDFVKRNAVDLSKFQITKELRTSVSSARQKYQLYLDEKKKTVSLKRKQHDDSKEIEELRKKKKFLEHDINELTKSADNYAEKAEETNDMTLIAKSNSHRRSAKEKRQKLVEIENLINDLEKQNIL